MSATPRELPLPPHFDPRHAAEWSYAPDQTVLFEQAAAWRAAQGIQPAGAATRDVHLLVIDAQKDFCFPQGSLFVGGRSGDGAIQDNARLSGFIYRNLGLIKNITVTMDTHFAFQIFFPAFWVDAEGRPLSAYRTITTAEIQAGRARPSPSLAWWLCNGNYPWLLKQVEFYCHELERAGKYELYLWPPHCLLGSDGHALAGIIHEARLFHSFVRGVQSWVEVKGGNVLTENYSVLRPEVLLRYDGHPLAQKNTGFLKTLLTADTVIIAGQASSHCVKSSIDDLLDEILTKDPDLARKVYILGDCMSAVAVPDGHGGFLADFTPQAEAALRRFAGAGMHVVSSTTPIADWPDVSI